MGQLTSKSLMIKANQDDDLLAIQNKARLIWKEYKRSHGKMDKPSIIKYLTDSEEKVTDILNTSSNPTAVDVKKYIAKIKIQLYLFDIDNKLKLSVPAIERNYETLSKEVTAAVNDNDMLTVSTIKIVCLEILQFLCDSKVRKDTKLVEEQFKMLINRLSLPQNLKNIQKRMCDLESIINESIQNNNIKSLKTIQKMTKQLYQEMHKLSVKQDTKLYDEFQLAEGIFLSYQDTLEQGLKSVIFAELQKIQDMTELVEKRIDEAKGNQMISCELRRNVENLEKGLKKIDTTISSSLKNRQEKIENILKVLRNKIDNKDNTIEFDLNEQRTEAKQEAKYVNVEGAQTRVHIFNGIVTTNDDSIIEEETKLKFEHLKRKICSIGAQISQNTLDKGSKHQLQEIHDQLSDYLKWSDEKVIANARNLRAEVRELLTKDCDIGNLKTTKEKIKNAEHAALNIEQQLEDKHSSLELRMYKEELEGVRTELYKIGNYLQDEEIVKAKGVALEKVNECLKMVNDQIFAIEGVPDELVEIEKNVNQCQNTIIKKIDDISILMKCKDDLRVYEYKLSKINVLNKKHNIKSVKDKIRQNIKRLINIVDSKLETVNEQKIIMALTIIKDKIVTEVIKETHARTYERELKRYRKDIGDGSLTVIEAIEDCSRNLEENQRITKMENEIHHLIENNGASNQLIVYKNQLTDLKVLSKFSENRRNSLIKILTSELEARETKTTIIINKEDVDVVAKRRLEKLNSDLNELKPTVENFANVQTSQEFDDLFEKILLINYEVTKNNKTSNKLSKKLLEETEKYSALLKKRMWQYETLIDIENKVEKLKEKHLEDLEDRNEVEDLVDDLELLLGKLEKLEVIPCLEERKKKTIHIVNKYIEQLNDVEDSFGTEV